MQRASKLLLGLAALFCLGATWMASPGKGSHASAAGPPAFNQLETSGTVGSSTSTTVTLPNAIASGKIIVLLTATNADAEPSSVSDTRGNTWTVETTQSDAFTSSTLCWAYVSTPIQASDTLTIVWDSASSQSKGWIVLTLNNCSSVGQPDAEVASGGFASSVSISASNTAANTVFIGQMVIDSGGKTYSGGSWTNVAAASDVGGNRTVQAVYKVTSSAASQSPGGSWSGAGTQYNVLTAFK